MKTQKILIGVDQADTNPREVDAEMVENNVARFEGQTYHPTHMHKGRLVFIPVRPK